jgi:hypothetical protein
MEVTDHYTLNLSLSTHPSRTKFTTELVLSVESLTF